MIDHRPPRRMGETITVLLFALLSHHHLGMAGPGRETSSGFAAARYS
jgi:hypothetical protein